MSEAAAGASAEAFFVQRDDHEYVATAYTSGPWDARAQHGGPPAALLVGAIGRASCRERV